MGRPPRRVKRYIYATDAEFALPPGSFLNCFRLVASRKFRVLFFFIFSGFSEVFSGFPASSAPTVDLPGSIYDNCPRLSSLPTTANPLPSLLPPPDVPS